MAWNAGSIVGTADLNTSKWVGGAKKMGGSMAGAMGIAAAAIGLVAGAFIKATKESQEFLKAFSNIDTIVDETSIDMQKLAKDVMLLDPALGSATEMSDGLYMSFSAGAQTAEEAMALTVQSAKFAKAGLTDLSTSVDAISTAMNAYGSDVIDAEKASDLFFQTIKLGKVTGAELASSIGQAIPQFAALGIPLEHLTAGLATMTKQGLSASESTTQLTALTNAFIKPSNEMAAALALTEHQTGSALLEAEGLTGALAFLEEQTGGNKEAIGELVPNIRGMKAVFALSGQGAQIYTDTLKEMGDSMGATEKAFQEQEKTIDTAKNAFTNLQITAGNLGNTFVNKIAVGATDAAQGMQRFIFSARGMESVANFAYIFSGALNTIKAILTPMLTGVFSAYKEMLSNLFDNISELTGGAENSNKVMQFLGGTVKVLTTYMSVFAKFINTAVDAIFDLIPVLIEGGKALGYYLVGDFEKASAAGTAFLNNTKLMAIGVKDNVVDIGTTVKDAFESFGTDSDKVTQDISDAWQVSAENSKNFVLDNYDELLTGQSAFAKKMNEQRKKQEEESAKEADAAADAAGKAGKKGAGFFSDAWTKAFEKVAEVAKSGKKATAEQVTEMGSLALEAVSMGLDALGSLVDNYHQQQLDAVSSFYDAKISRAEQYYNKEAETLADEQRGLTNELYNQELEDLEDLNNRKLITQEEFLVASLELEKQYGQETINSREELDAILENDKLSYEDRQKFIDEYYANQAANTADDKEAAILKIEKKAAIEKNKVAKKAFEAEKAQKIGQVWIDAMASQLGYISWGAPLGPPGWIAAAIAGAASLTMAGVQTGLIASQQYTPSYATGTQSHGGGLAVVGDKPSGQGGELVNLPAGTSVTPTVQTSELLSAMDGLSNLGNNNTGVTNVFDFSGTDFGNSSESDIQRIVETSMNTIIREVI